MIESSKNQIEKSAPKQKKPYQSPELVRYGPITELTAGNVGKSIGDNAMPVKT
jgi:hypothetical protein